MNLLECIVIASEKAANIARICRQDRHLFDLLVREKNSDEANPRFVRDFTTLADVLIQETVKRDIGKKFPMLAADVKGEESNVFSNCLGETIEVKVLDSQEGTSSLLKEVLNGDCHAAELLAEAVHEDLNLASVNTRKDFPDDDPFDNTKLGVWIDPIDSTSEYINGTEKKSENGIYLSGLRCVTVLIGVYNRSNGNPIMGVLNQPFYENVEGKWRGKCYWGTNRLYESIRSSPQPPTGVICISTSEDDDIKDKLKNADYKLIETAGAGYKMLTVIEGLADAYILSKNSTFKWDSCGPQAILNSFGGGLVVYEAGIQGDLIEVSYGENEEDAMDKAEDKSKIEKYCNVGGIIAYNSVNVLNDILKTLRK